MKSYFDDMEQFRCPTCNRLFFRYRLKGSLQIEIKCTRCSNVTNLIVSNKE